MTYRPWAMDHRPLLMPSMHLTHLDHGGKDIIPGFLLHHDFIRKHASIPTDVFEGLGQLPILIAQPVACIGSNVKFAIGIGSLAVASGLIVRPGAKYRSVILGNVEINSPRTQRLRYFFKGVGKYPAILPVKIFR